jgi:hypothetical protein
MSAADMMAAASIATTTWYAIMQKPEGITVQQLLAIANGLHIPVRRFFSFGRMDYIGRRADYITEPYQSCRYDAEALQEIVSTQPSATWKQAAEAAGMAPSRLRDSLLALTRTPVERFLVVCDVFSIDPFTILIDPNPDPRHTAPKKNTEDNSFDSLREEIKTLHEDMKSLSQLVSSLADKYKVLYDKHQALSNRFDMFERNNREDFLDLAAESEP